ncbi:MAG: gliding motility-associated C-terminal domain-containing protein [Chitinophagaceae bacterium]|nr:gliding motility-associated C-terminal domain-containing protein [Chitinophagaceae bacterium]
MRQRFRNIVCLSVDKLYFADNIGQKIPSLKYFNFIKTKLPLLLLAAAVTFSFSLAAQPCTTLGQTPSTAFPVCGTSVFSQSNVPSCTNSVIRVPGCSSDLTYQDVNPFWYKFTCFTSGTLGLTINPVNPDDDYDWQIFDITGLNPDVVFTNNAIVVGANWSGLTGETGTRSNANGLIECGSFNNNNPPKYSRLPNIVAGRTYLLMVSNFSNSQQGYRLSFSGGTAVITDPKEPLMQDVKPNCGGDELRLKLNKKMKCSSIALNGSDVVSFPGGITAVSMRPIGCNNSFETDSVIITLSQPLPPGNYTLRLKNGTDNNTIVDLCDRAIPTTDVLNFSYQIPQPTRLDSIAPVTCSPNEVRFVFKKLIRCSSIDPGGSDFSIAGTYPVTITGARGNCNADGLTSDIIVSFAQPLKTRGSFIITLRQGFDGNTIIDECNQVTPVSQLGFSVKDTVSADFNFNILFGCLADTVDYTHPGGNEINSWLWNFGSAGGSINQNAQVIYRTFGVKTATLIVSNGFCRDTVTKTINLDNFIKADFAVNPFHCPDSLVAVNPLPLSERSFSFLWEFGDGQTSTDSIPLPHLYPTSTLDQKFKIRYTITNDLGCSSTIEKTITVVKTCRIDVPNAFTPNGDGLNDFFGPLNAVIAGDFVFRIFNRWGNLLFESKNWLEQWDGTFKGLPQEAGNYVWTLTYTDITTSKQVSRRGSFILIR